MKHHALTLLLTVSAAAQTLPLGVPQKPYVGTVTAKIETGDSLKITVSDGEATHTLMQSGSLSPLARKAFRQLQVGRKYSFPERFDLPTDETKSFKLARLLDLEKQPPFRALVDDLRTEDDHVSLFLRCGDGRKLHFRHEGGKGRDQARQLVATLQTGMSYEFPACLQPAPPAPATIQRDAALSQYIGEWRGTMEGDASCFITMNCTWKADGQGLWREIMFDNSSADPPLHDVAIVTADPATGRYLAYDPQDRGKPAMGSTYEAATRTFTTRLPSTEPGVTRVNTATFTNDDTIDWKTTTQDASGAVLSTTRGSYKRLGLAGTPLSITPFTHATGQPGASADLQKLFQNLQRSTTQEVVPHELLDLRKLPPFRAKVTQCQVSDTAIEILLEIPDRSIVTVRHTGKDDWQKAASLARRLEAGRTYEFPEVLADDYSPPPASPPSPAMQALAPFIGEWTMHLKEPPKGRPASQTSLRYFWKADGTGLWREATYQSLDSQPADRILQVTPRMQATLITYDAARQRYIETNSAQIHRTVETLNGVRIQRASFSNKALNSTHHGTWDATTQTYTWEGTSDQPEPGTRQSGTRRFASPDRIEWQAKAVKTDGTLLHESTGHYQRIQP